MPAGGRIGLTPDGSRHGGPAGNVMLDPTMRVPLWFRGPTPANIVLSQTLAGTAGDVSVIADSVAAARAYQRAAADTSLISDTAAASRQTTGHAADTTLSADSAAQSVSRARVAADATLTADTALGAAQRARTAADTTLSTDAAAPTAARARTAADTSLTADAAARALAHPRPAADTTLTADTAAGAAARSRATADTTLTADALTTVKGPNRAGADTTLTAETAAGAAVRARAAADTSLTSDALTVVKGPNRAAADTTLTVDAAARALAHPRQIPDTSLTSDAAAQRAARARAAADTSLIADTVAAGRALARAAADTSLIADGAHANDILARAGGTAGAPTVVGARGAVATSSNGGGLTPAYGAGANRAPGNLLVCFVSGAGHSGPGPSATGWTTVAAGFGTPAFCVASLMYRWATGGDAAPAIGGVSGMVWIAQLVEFTGLVANATPLTGSANGGGATTTAALPSADASPGSLFISCATTSYGTLGARSLTPAPNNGIVDQQANNNAANLGQHFSFDLGVTNTNAAPDQQSITVSSTTSLSGTCLLVASFPAVNVVELSLISDTAAPTGQRSRQVAETSTTGDAVTTTRRLQRAIGDVSLTSDTARKGAAITPIWLPTSLRLRNPANTLTTKTATVGTLAIGRGDVGAALAIGSQTRTLAIASAATSNTISAGDHGAALALKGTPQGKLALAPTPPRTLTIDGPE